MDLFSSLGLKSLAVILNLKKEFSDTLLSPNCANCGIIRDTGNENAHPPPYLYHHYLALNSCSPFLHADQSPAANSCCWQMGNEAWQSCLGH